MPLWGKTDAKASQPKWIKTADGTPGDPPAYVGTGAFLDTNTYPAGTSIVFVDETEAQVAANKARGINGAGWWKIVEKTDSSGNTRYNTELLVAIDVTALAAGDQSDDAIVADVVALITIGTQPADATTVSGAAEFTVVASVDPTAVLSYQWQSAAVGSSRYSNISGATTDTLSLTGLTEADDGTRYRVVVTSANGAPAVTSSVAVVTFGD